MLSIALLGANRDKKLAHMALYVFGCMDQQTKDRRRKSGTTHRARFRQRSIIGGAKLIERAIDLCEKRGHQILRRNIRLRHRLHRQRLHLRRTERLSSSIGKESIDDAG